MGVRMKSNELKAGSVVQIKGSLWVFHFWYNGDNNLFAATPYGISPNFNNLRTMDLEDCVEPTDLIRALL